NKYIVDNAPWAVAEKGDEESRARLGTILYVSAEALRIATALAYPVIPDSAAKIWSQLGLGDISKTDLRDLKWGQLHLGTKLGPPSAVSPRAKKSSIKRMKKMEELSPPKTDDKKKDVPAGVGAQPAQAATQATAAAPVASDGKITIDD